MKEVDLALMNLLNIGVVLQLLALVVWTGGIFSLLFVQGGSVLTGVADARDIRSRALRRFSGVEVIAGLVLLTGGGMLYLADVQTRYVACNLVLSGLMYAIFIIYGFGISQKMEMVQTQVHGESGETPDHTDPHRYRLLSRICAFLMSANLLLGIAQIVLLVVVLSRIAEPPGVQNDTMNLFDGGAFGSF